MTDNLKKFLEAVSKSEELVAKVGNEKDVNALIAVAKEMGMELTAADFEKEQEISDDELDAVTGGFNLQIAFSTAHLAGKNAAAVDEW